MSDLLAKRLLYESINLGVEYRPSRHHPRLEIVVLSLLSGFLGGMFSGWLLGVTTQ